MRICGGDDDHDAYAQIHTPSINVLLMTKMIMTLEQRWSLVSTHSRVANASVGRDDPMLMYDLARVAGMDHMGLPLTVSHVRMPSLQTLVEGGRRHIVPTFGWCRTSSRVSRSSDLSQLSPAGNDTRACRCTSRRSSPKFPKYRILVEPAFPLSASFPPNPVFTFLPVPAPYSNRR